MVIEKLIGLDKKDPKRIAIIGDALTDVWIHGKLLPSQDGCEKFVEEYRAKTPGGAANAVYSLNDWDVAIDGYFVEHSLRGVKTRYLVDDRIVFRHDNDARARYSSKIQGLHKYDAILLSDYDKGYLSSDIMARLIRQANELGIPIVTDCKRHPDIYAGAILKGNCDYYNTYGRLDIVTRGSASPEVNGKALEELPPVKCVNHIGAGDCFAAHLTLALAYGFSLEDAARVAHKAGWVYIQYPHNRPPRKEEIANVR